MRAAIRRNWLFAVFLAVGFAIRLLTMIAYPPALFFGDSWGYLAAAFGGHFVSLPYLRPVGYSVLIRLLTLPDRGITRLIAIQHLAGLATGTLVYLAAVRARIPRAAAAAAAALVLLDGYAVTLEQYVMADTLYTLTLLAAVLLLVWPRQSKARPQSSSTAMVALAGLLVACGAIERQVGIWVIPTFVIYLLWVRVPRRQLLAFLVALLVPLGAYAGVMKARSGVLGLTATSGWTLYARVAGFADCDGAGIAADARPLCETAAQRDSHPRAPDWYLFARASPAAGYFRRARESAGERARTDAILRGFAKLIVLHQPGTYLRSVAGSFLEFFTPGATAYNDAVSATSLPVSVRRETIDRSLRRRLIPRAHPVVRAPAGVIRAYRGVVHVPRPVLALLALASILAVLLRTAARREILLTSGTALLLLLGTAATGGFGLRYLLPAVPLLALGGALAVRDLVDGGLRAPQRRRGRGAVHDSRSLHS